MFGAGWWRIRVNPPVSVQSVALYAAFKSAARRAKLPLDFNQHDLRHRRVTTWLAEGKNLVHVKEAMGHADLATTMGDTHMAKEHLRSLVEQEPKREE